MKQHNNGLIHSECAAERQRKFQATLGNKVIPVGNWAKIRFTDPADESLSEHMWVNITEQINPQMYNGTLDNDPVTLTNIKCGDPVTFSRTDIEDIYPPL